MHNYKVNIIITAQKKLEFRTKAGILFNKTLGRRVDEVERVCNSHTD